MTSITIRWAGPSTAGERSEYRIERSLDNSQWDELGSQPSTPPYAGQASTLNKDTPYGSKQIVLLSAAGFSNSGFGWLDDALIQWSNIIGDMLDGCFWHTGAGIYAAETLFFEANESYSEDIEAIPNNAALYRITHIDQNRNESAPLIIWFYNPPKPASSQHCVVIVNIGADLGLAPQAGVSVQAYLASDNQFGLVAGQHLDTNAGTANTTTTNALGLAFFHCWKDAARFGAAGAADAAYLFVLKPGTGQLVVTAEAIPDDRDWVLLSQIATAAGSSRSYLK